MGAGAESCVRTRTSGEQTMTPIKAVYNGIQDGPHPFELWTILEPMGCTCHGQFSSLSINTIHAHGFEPVEEKE